MKIKILIAAHKKTPSLSSDVFQPIHVGRDISSENVRNTLSHYIGDNTGDNISNKNIQYAEVTALYWAWKNLDKDVSHVGLMHYGRFFNFSNENYSYPENIFDEINDNTISKFKLNDETLYDLCSKFDLIIPEKWAMKKEHIQYEHKRYNHYDEKVLNKLKCCDEELDLYEHYSLCHVRNDIDIAIDIIKDKYPEISKSMKISLTEKKARFTNMFVMKRDIFEKYCTFLFDVFFEMEKKKNYFSNEIYAKGSFHSRIFGFLAERLFSIYLDYIINFEGLKYVEKQIVFANFKDTPDEIVESNDNERFNIVISSDDNYAPYLVNLIKSVVKNQRAQLAYDFFILDGGISKKNKNIIANFSHGLGINVEFVEIDTEIFVKSCPLVDASKHITLPTYFRFALARLLPKNMSKVLYLDVDVIVNTDISDMYKTDISDCYAAVVEDTYDYTAKVAKNIGIDGKYFNAGIMLINLDMWRKSNIEDLFFKNTEKIYEKIVFVDQDVINFTLNGKVKFIDLKWNVQQTSYTMTKKSISKEAIENAISNPCIIHFSGHIKPWEYDYKSWHPLTNIYYDYLSDSPYKCDFFKYRLSNYLFPLKHKIFGSLFEFFTLRKPKLKVMFDYQYYSNLYGNEVSFYKSPLLHYCLVGWKKGYNPNPSFSTVSYLESNKDIKEKGINPFFHYLVNGIRERRKV